MKQAIYILSLYIGAVTFYTMTSFGYPAEIGLIIAALTAVAAVLIGFVLNRSEGKTLAA